MVTLTLYAGLDTLTARETLVAYEDFTTVMLPFTFSGGRIVKFFWGAAVFVTVMLGIWGLTRVMVGGA
jgi:hypothetical protein